MTLPKPPAHLSREARALWRRITRGWQLDESGLILLAQALTAWDRAEEARRLVAAHGIVQTDARGRQVAHPAVGIEKDARLQFARLWRALRLDEDPPGMIGRPPGR